MERIDNRERIGGLRVPINVDTQKVGAVVFDKMISAIGEAQDTIGRQNEALKTWLKISADLGRCLMEDPDFKPIPGEAVPEESAARVIRALRAEAWACGNCPKVRDLEAENAVLRQIWRPAKADVDDDNVSLCELFDFLRRSPGFDPGDGEKITEAAMRYITHLLDRLEGRDKYCDARESDQPATRPPLDFWQI